MQVFLKIFYTIVVKVKYTLLYLYMPKTILTITEYAKRANIKRDTVYKQINRNDLPKNVRVLKVAGKNFIEIREMPFSIKMSDFKTRQ